jgi:DNA polymerase-3 subunit epsilon
VDFSSHLIYNDKGEAVINFGKHKGKTAKLVYMTEPSYFAWIQQGSFTLDTKRQFEKLEEQFRLEKLQQKFNRR